MQHFFLGLILGALSVGAPLILLAAVLQERVSNLLYFIREISKGTSADPVVDARNFIRNQLTD